MNNFADQLFAVSVLGMALGVVLMCGGCSLSLLWSIL